MKKFFYYSLLYVVSFVSFSNIAMSADKLVIDQSIQEKNKPAWDYLEKDIECKNDVCFDKQKQKINGTVKEEMFDFYVTIPYVNGEPKGVAKFYTQKNEFVSKSTVNGKQQPSIPSDPNFGIMMEKVAKDKYATLSFLVYLSECARSYSMMDTKKTMACKKLVKNTEETKLVKSNDLSAKKVSKDGKNYVAIEIQKLPKKYRAEFNKRIDDSDFEMLIKNKEGKFIYYLETFDAVLNYK